MLLTFMLYLCRKFYIDVPIKACYFALTANSDYFDKMYEPHLLTFCVTALTSKLLEGKSRQTKVLKGKLNK